MLVSGHGSSKPSIMFIGDYPMGEDLSTKYALSGFIGHKLKGNLGANNLSIDATFRTLLIKDKFDPKFYKKQKKLQWDKLDTFIKPYLEQIKFEIRELQPYLIMPLGEISMHYITGFNSLHKFRGSILQTSGDLQFNPPIKVLPVLGPDLVMKNYKMDKITRNIDFAKIPKYLNHNLPPENLIRPWVATSAAEFRAFVQRSWPLSDFFTFDWETRWGIPTCIAFCFDGVEACCAPLMDKSISTEDRMLMLDITAKLLSSEKNKGNQNVKYDWKIAERWNLPVNNVVDDTMLAASVLYCEYPKNLGFLTSIYTDIPYFKDEGKEATASKDIKKSKYYLYCAKDTIATWQIRRDQKAELKHFNVEWVYQKLIECTPMYMKMENHGLLVDTAQRDKLIDKYELLHHMETLRVRALAGMPGFNPASHQQCAALIFEQLGYDRKTRGVKGTDEESLLLLLASSKKCKYAPSIGPLILEHIINCRKIHKVLEILYLPLYPDGRFRCEFNLAGTGTGRTAAGSTTDAFIYYGDFSKKLGRRKIESTDLGHSLQTIGKHGFLINGVRYGKDIRSMFVPSKGYAFVEVDLSQAEARADAVFANNFEILKVFDGPTGIHRLTASWIYNCNPEDIKKNTEQYQVGKTVRHAGERNMMADRLLAMLQKPIGECQKILKIFHEFQPEIRNVFHKAITACVVGNDHTIIAPNGRRYTFFNRPDHSAINQGISFLPQAIVSDQTKFYGMLPTFGKFEWARALTEQHDGVLAEVPIGREEEYGLEYKRNVEYPIDFRTGSLPRDIELIIPAEISIGRDNWSDLKEIH